MVGALVAGSGAAAAMEGLPLLGKRAAAVVVRGSDGAERALAGDGKAVLVIYEDRDGGKENGPAKELLGRLNASAQNRAHVEVVAVADVERYDFWPARKYVLEDIKKTEQRARTTVFIDWKGAVRKSWGLPKGHSSLVLVDNEGKVRWATAGTLDGDEVTRLRALLGTFGVEGE